MSKYCSANILPIRNTEKVREEDNTDRLKARSQIWIWIWLIFFLQFFCSNKAAMFFILLGEV